MQVLVEGKLFFIQDGFQPPTSFRNALRFNLAFVRKGRKHFNSGDEASNPQIVRSDSQDFKSTSRPSF